MLDNDILVDIVNIMADDVFTTQGTKASADMILKLLSQNSPHIAW